MAFFEEGDIVGGSAKAGPAGGRRPLVAVVLVCSSLVLAALPAGAEVAEIPAVASNPSVTAPDDPRTTSVPLPPGPERVPAEGAPVTVPTGTPASGEAPLATSPSGTGPIPADGRPDVPALENDLFDTLYGGISTRFLATAAWLDSFFGDERYEAELNRSQVKIRFEAFRESGAGMNFFRPNFDLRLVLPQMRQKTRLLISGDPNVDTDTTTAKPGTAPGRPPKGTDRNLTTSLQVVPVETAQTNFSIRAGVKFHSGRFEAIAGPRFRYLMPLESPWVFRFTQEFPWSTAMRWQSRTRFDLERPLPDDLFFRSSVEGLWSENVVGYTYNLSCTLRQPLDRDRALQYEWVNTFTTQPFNGLVEELLILRYRQRFLRQWLFLEVAPQYRFPRSRGFEAVPGVFFRLEMVFGDIRHIF